MIRYIVKRLLIMIPVLLGVTLLVFTLLYFAEGDPVKMVLGSEATEEEIYAQREEWGLNDPYLERFAKYVKQVFLEFDLGTSYINNRSVSEEIVSRFPKTFMIALGSVIIAVLVGLPLGTMAATNQYTWKDNASMVLALLGVSMPNFWFALILSLLFALQLGWLPASGFGTWEHLVMPCVALGIGGAGSIARQMRSSMLEVIRQDYISTAKAKGQKYSKIIWGHAMRNALVPIIQTAGNMLGTQLAGAIVVESIFSIPGIGSYLISAIKSRDYPAVQGGVLYVAIVFSLIMLLVDLSFAFIDPRIRGQYQKRKDRTKKEASA